MLYYSTEADKYSLNHGTKSKLFNQLILFTCIYFHFCCLIYITHLLSLSLTSLFFVFTCSIMRLPHIQSNTAINNATKGLFISQIYQTFLVQSSIFTVRIIWIPFEGNWLLNRTIRGNKQRPIHTHSHRHTNSQIEMWSVY